ncbi:MAG: hypothetical protein K9N46_08625 [Candidatus Marinimicrobia bacterium]|nr:hypothetical protein [Candidatus Neomarinimicrobiota bacterium]MCF7828871.1 hypothetical protein [Candidatus Neomarinimicrobiota bacterium]MCF7880789.1 hypothetical protein [Candidatus Neomarinimicrobiota bacterium]
MVLLKSFELKLIILSISASLLFANEITSNIPVTNYFEEVEEVNISISENSLITGMSFSKDKIFVCIDYNYVVVFNAEGDIEKKFGRDEFKPFTANNAISYSNQGFIYLSHIINGRSYLSKYSLDGILISDKKFHPIYINGIKINSSNNILIGGLNIRKYKSMLEKYDRNSLFFAKKYKKIWRNYFKEATGQWITELNSSFEQVDSIFRVQDDIRPRLNAAYLNIFSFDIDTSQNIWAYAFPDSGLRIFNASGDGFRYMPLKENDYKIPEIYVPEERWKIIENNNALYFDYELLIIEPYIFISYETNNKDKNNSSRKMSVYTTDGEFLERFDFPYRPFKHENALYFWVEEKGKLQLIRCSN